MSRFIVIDFGKLGVQVRAQLLEDSNPVVCDAFARSLPSKSVLSHAVVAGSQMYWPYRLLVDPRDCNSENMAAQPPGRINIELDFQYLSLNYGPMTEAVPAVAIAQIVEEDLPKLSPIGQAAWDNLLHSDDYIVLTITLAQGGAV